MNFEVYSIWTDDRCVSVLTDKEQCIKTIKDEFIKQIKTYVSENKQMLVANLNKDETLFKNNIKAFWDTGNNLMGGKTEEIVDQLLNKVVATIFKNNGHITSARFSEIIYEVVENIINNLYDPKIYSLYDVVKRCKYQPEYYIKSVNNSDMISLLNLDKKLSHLNKHNMKIDDRLNHISIQIDNIGATRLDEKLDHINKQIGKIGINNNDNTYNGFDNNPNPWFENCSLFNNNSNVGFNDRNFRSYSMNMMDD